MSRRKDKQWSGWFRSWVQFPDAPFAAPAVADDPPISSGTANIRAARSASPPGQKNIGCKKRRTPLWFGDPRKALPVFYTNTGGEKSQMYNRYVCEFCGANLDPGELCDCQKEAGTGKRGSENAKNSSDQFKGGRRENNDGAEHGV